MDGKHHDIDNLFKNAFENHEVTPPSDLWAKIEQDLPLTETDRLFKQAFTNYEVDPSPEVWLRIKRHLPLSLVLRKHLTWLSKVAAVLVIGMLSYALLESNGFFISTTDPAVAIEEDTTTIETDVIAQQQSEETTENEAVHDLPKLERTPTNDKEDISDDIPGNEHEYDAPVIDNRPSVIENPIADGSFVNQPGNTAKGGGEPIIEATKLNVDAIAESEEKGDGKRIRYNKLVSTEYISTKPEVKIDSALLKKQQELKKKERLLVPPLKRRQEDIAAIDMNILRYDNTEEESSHDQVSSGVYLSLQGQDDDAFDNTHKGVLGRNNTQKEWANAVLEFRGLYLSGSAEMNNSWVFNNALRNEFITMSDSKVDYGVNFDHAFGLELGFQFAPKWALQSGIRFSNQGQRYRELSSSDKKVTTMRQTYLSLPLTFKYRMNKISGAKPATISYVFGTQFNFLQRSPALNVTSLEGTEDAPEITESLLVQREAGIVLGVDYDLFLNRNSSWTIGARASLGTDMIPSATDIPRTYNFLVGIRTAFNFRLINKEN